MPSSFLALVIFTSAVCARSCIQQDLTVTTKNGIIHGTVDKKAPDVRQFLGIPYGLPPVGDLRFTPPQPAKYFGEIDAKELPPSCLQYLGSNAGVYITDVLEFNQGGLNGSVGPMSEDCLTLSVWAPRGKKEKLPVFLWIYGGSFTTGGQNVPYQLPPQWIQRMKNHIVVSFNYRLNFFGFPNAAGLDDDKQNLGLLDQRLAVEWVRDNIEAFGGDPDRIGLWGQSAGAISVGYYSYAHPNDPIVSSLIMDSGNELLDISTVDPTHSNFTFMASQFGCGELGPAKELSCMRKVDAYDIEVFLHVYNDNGTMPKVSFSPIADGKTVFTDYTAKALAGEIAKLPAILGSNKEDGVPFVPYGFDGVNETLAKEATSLYFFCPAWKSAANRLVNGIPVYRYRYAGNFSNISPKGWMGAWHSAELPLIFGTHPNYRGDSTKLEYATSHVMQDAWVAFVAGAGSDVAMAAQEWPVYAQVSGGMVRDFGDGVAAQTISTSDLESQCTE